MPGKRVVFLADCQSFYASVEKVANPQYKDQPVVVAGDPARRSGVILAACPIAKQYGVKTAERLGEALAKCPGLVVIKPRMQRYIDVSQLITDIFLRYTDMVEPYSIDEQFLDVTGSLHLFGSPEEMASLIQHRVMLETGIHTRIGISETKVLAKMACDNFAKKNESGIYTLLPSQLEETLWTLPIPQLFMAGSRMTAHFQMMGISTIGDLARTPLDKLKAMMRRRFGKNSDINAELYWRIANGIDNSPVTPGTHEAVPKSVGHMMTLPRDYALLEDIKVIVLELTELVCRRCRGIGYMGRTVSVSCMGADYDNMTGFSRQAKLLDPTHVTNQVYQAAMELLLKHWDGQPVRRIGVSLSGLVDDSVVQLDLFDPTRDRTMALERVTDQLKARYGEAVILRASSLTESGQAADRAAKIGGHYR
ncbi:DNA polymerase IV [Paenibacillus sp. 598K]|uniref:DNA polymerase IV n=1 Tax=Paenibacillus sp. 598K TaxID=1117987 RepID=UPI000FF9C930|nr:DNA polymerase IV [Paenibacillus sp. 598K]GBF73193.1 DNA polymerase IV [Paenibacillus sp. 598K]